MKRAIQKEVETPLARKIVSGEVRDGQKVFVTERNRELVFEVESGSTGRSIIKKVDKKMAEKQDVLISTLPLLPLKNSVLFPGLLMPLSVGRPGSIAAVENALGTEEKEIVVVTQRDPNVDAPTANDLYTIGTRAVIRKAGRSKDQIRDSGARHGARGARQGEKRTGT